MTILSPWKSAGYAQVATPMSTTHTEKTLKALAGAHNIPMTHMFKKIVTDFAVSMRANDLIEKDYKASKQ